VMTVMKFTVTQQPLVNMSSNKLYPKWMKNIKYRHHFTYVFKYSSVPVTKYLLLETIMNRKRIGKCLPVWTLVSISFKILIIPTNFMYIPTNPMRTLQKTSNLTEAQVSPVCKQLM